MIGQCCIAERRPHRVVRRLSTVAGSVLPAVLLMFLPKCPFCFAAWLTVATGIGFTADGAAWVRASILLLWAAMLAGVLWTRVFGGGSKSVLRMR